jgi:tRNA(fMet)-specific endonuclease VapC
MKYMLDTDICITLIRQKPAALLRQLTSREPGQVGISGITLAELVHGVEKSAQPEHNLSALQQFLLPLELADFDQQAALAYGKIRKSLERDGRIIGSMDMLIAAHAIGLGATLVTNNEGEFKRIDGLVLDNWIKKTR